MNIDPYPLADTVHDAYPMLLALATLSAVVAIVTGSVTTLHALGVILTAFGVFWYHQYDPEAQF